LALYLRCTQPPCLASTSSQLPSVLSTRYQPFRTRSFQSTIVMDWSTAPRVRPRTPASPGPGTQHLQDVSTSRHQNLDPPAACIHQGAPCQRRPRSPAATRAIRCRTCGTAAVVVDESVHHEVLDRTVASGPGLVGLRTITRVVNRVRRGLEYQLRGSGSHDEKLLAFQ
jgi:hypothetical protein